MFAAPLWTVILELDMRAVEALAMLMAAFVPKKEDWKRLEA